MTGDDHGNGGTAGRFDAENAAEPAGLHRRRTGSACAATSYVYTTTPLTDAQATSYSRARLRRRRCTSRPTARTGRRRRSTTSTRPSSPTGRPSSRACRPRRRTERTASCGATTTTQPHVELAHGIRFDTNLLLLAVVVDRRTGPGCSPARDAACGSPTADGDTIDVYQAATQMTDESGQSVPGQHRHAARQRPRRARLLRRVHGEHAHRLRRDRRRSTRSSRRRRRAASRSCRPSRCSTGSTGATRRRSATCRSPATSSSFTVSAGAAR